MLDLNDSSNIERGKPIMAKQLDPGSIAAVLGAVEHDITARDLALITMGAQEYLNMPVPERIAYVVGLKLTVPANKRGALARKLTTLLTGDEVGMTEFLDIVVAPSPEPISGEGSTPASQQTAYKRRVKQANPLEGIVPHLPPTYHMFCSAADCGLDLTDYAEGEDVRGGVDALKVCPKCKRRFEEKTQRLCVSCDHPLNSDGFCTNCSGSGDYDEVFKIFIIQARFDSIQGGHPISAAAARASARQFKDDPDLQVEVLPKARKDRWIERVEEGGLAALTGGSFQGLNTSSNAQPGPKRWS